MGIYALSSALFVTFDVALFAEVDSVLQTLIFLFYSYMLYITFLLLGILSQLVRSTLRISLLGS